MPKNNKDYEDYEDDDYEDDDYEDDEDGEYESEYTDDEKQDCFNLVVASFISSILADDSVIENDEDKSELVNQILNILDEHLDEEGSEYLTNAFLKFEKEYAIQVHTHEIISNLEWNKNKNEND